MRKSTSNQVSENLKRIDEFRHLVSVISDSESSARIFGEIKAHLFKAGKPIDDFDIHIASVVMAEKATLITNNQAHFERISALNLANWL